MPGLIFVVVAQAGLQVLNALLKAQPGGGEVDLVKTLQAQAAQAQNAQVLICPQPSARQLPRPCLSSATPCVLYTPVRSA